MSSESRVQRVDFGHVNIYFIKTETGHILVDAGMPNKGDELDERFAKAGVDQNSVQLIVLTHGHLDHVGSVAHAKKVTGGQVLCHRSFSESLTNGRPEAAVAQNLLGRVLNLMTSLMGNKFEGIQPDIVIDDEYDLADHGISGRIIHTPGHSPSSVSIVLDNGEALVGDLVREEGSGRIGLGMFFEDKRVALESIEKVAAFDPDRIYLSHGAYIDNTTLKDFIASGK